MKFGGSVLVLFFETSLHANFILHLLSFPQQNIQPFIIDTTSESIDLAKDENLF